MHWQSLFTLCISTAWAAISPELHGQLIYYAKFCALASCITNDGLKETRFDKGGCPSSLRFCSIESTAEHNEIVYVHKPTDTRTGAGYVALDHSSHAIIVGFRSSTTHADWVSDFRIRPVLYLPVTPVSEQRGNISSCGEKCLVHRGFAEAMPTVYNTIILRAQQFYNTYNGTYRMIVLGHSLGAALATLTAIELRLQGLQPLLLTYGQPRVFNSEMAGWVDNELFPVEETKELLNMVPLLPKHGYVRVVHKNDYVTMVPPYYYKHSGIEVFISKREHPQGPEDCVLVDSFENGADELQCEKNALSTGVDPHNSDRICTQRDFQTLFPTASIPTKSLERLLNMYEHRSYFLMVNKCGNF